MTQPATTQTYRVQGVSRPGGHSRIQCNDTDIKADTGSISDGYRPGPAELLCAALAACLLKNVERFAEILPFEYEVASVVVDAQRRDSPPAMTKMHYTLEVVSDEPPHRVELLHHNVLKFGTITNTLAAAVELTGVIVERHDPSEIGLSDGIEPSNEVG
jgi:uncharacterized OsmC-like protein